MTGMIKPSGGRHAGALLVGLVLVGANAPADAATIANADRLTRTITVIKGAQRADQQLKAGGLIVGLCPDGCIVRIDKDPKRDFVLEGRERVTIEDGLLYYDGELAATTAKSGKRK